MLWASGHRSHGESSWDPSSEERAASLMYLPELPPLPPPPLPPPHPSVQDVMDRGQVLSPSWPSLLPSSSTLIPPLPPVLGVHRCLGLGEAALSTPEGPALGGREERPDPRCVSDLPGLLAGFMLVGTEGRCLLDPMASGTPDRQHCFLKHEIIPQTYSDPFQPVELKNIESEGSTAKSMGS